MFSGPVFAGFEIGDDNDQMLQGSGPYVHYGAIYFNFSLGLT